MEPINKHYICVEYCYTIIWRP